MNKIYAQVINGIVNLIGGSEVGLPNLNINVINIDITDMVIKPNIGDHYINGIFTDQITTPIVPIILQPTNQEINDNLEIVKQGMMDIYIAVYDTTQGAV